MVDYSTAGQGIRVMIRSEAGMDKPERDVDCAAVEAGQLVNAGPLSPRSGRNHFIIIGLD